MSISKSRKRLRERSVLRYCIRDHLFFHPLRSLEASGNCITVGGRHAGSKTNKRRWPLRRRSIPITVKLWAGRCRKIGGLFVQWTIACGDSWAEEERVKYASTWSSNSFHADGLWKAVPVHGIDRKRSSASAWSLRCQSSESFYRLETYLAWSDVLSRVLDTSSEDSSVRINTGIPCLFDEVLKLRNRWLGRERQIC